MVRSALWVMVLGGLAGLAWFLTHRDRSEETTYRTGTVTRSE